MFAHVEGHLLAIIVAGLLFTTAVALIVKRASSKHKLPLPPKPPGLFLIGNLLDVKSAAEAKTLHELFGRWALEYGDIYRIKVGPVTHYFLNSDKAVKVMSAVQSVRLIR